MLTSGRTAFPSIALGVWAIRMGAQIRNPIITTSCWTLRLQIQSSGWESGQAMVSVCRRPLLGQLTLKVTDESCSVLHGLAIRGPRLQPVADDREGSQVSINVATWQRGPGTPAPVSVTGKQHAQGGFQTTVSAGTDVRGSEYELWASPRNACRKRLLRITQT